MYRCEKVQKKIKEQEYELFLEQIRAYERKGTHVTLEGFRELPEEIARICIMEETGCYMADFIADEKGRLSEVRFNKISEREL